MGIENFYRACICVVVLLNIKHCRASQISIKTAEMTSIGSSLVKIPHELKLTSVEEREFKILSGKEYAKVDQRTGILTVASLMDREKICPDNREKCYVDIAVVVLPLNEKTSPTSLLIVKIQIEITDINDNRPEFENPMIDKMISEGVDVGTSIRLDSAVDKDLGINSIQRYAIRSAKGSKFPIEDYFKLEVIRNIDGTKIPQLVLLNSLDREKQGVHRLILEAIDGGTPALTGVATVRINVTDSNDNNPTFDQSVYIVNVDEHTSNNTVIKKLHAEDKDTGMNGKIRYKFPSVVSTEDREIFSLNPETGEISIRNGKKLDYELKRIHHLTVEASDLGPNSASAYTTVTVQVQDINDNKPQVEVSFMELEKVVVGDPHSNYDAIIREDIDVGSYIAFVTITDKDGGKNGSVSCRIANNDVFELQSIEENTSRFLLKIVSALDREDESFYDVDVEAWDHGTPSQENRRIVRIKVGDLNDNAPAFIHDEFSVGVSETADAGTVVMTLKAKDIDESPGPNSRITYELLPSTVSISADGEEHLLTDIFNINPDSGEIRLELDGVLDAETVREPGYLIVSATDNGIPRRNTTTKLKITIIDENDNDPKFEKDSYVFRILEHSNDGFYVGQVKAVDLDASKDSNGLVNYNVERYEDNSDEDQWLQMFQIDRKTGFIHFYGNKSKLDREARRGLPVTITAVATDSGSPRRTARVRIDIFLKDINDNSPVVTYPDVTKDIAFVQVPSYLMPTSTSEESGKGADETNNDGIIISSTNTRSRHNDNSKWASVVILPKQEYVEGIGLGPTLIQVQATDADEGGNAQITYAIIQGNDRGYFEIDFADGNITFTSDLDFSNLRMGCHVLEILVKDLGDNQLSSNAYVNIFLSRSDPRSVNQSDAMLDCQNNTLYPHDYEHQLKGAGLDQLTIFIIIGFAVMIFIILIIIVVILVKCKCCSNPKQSRTYNCQQGSNLYSSPIYGSPKKKKNKKSKGSYRHDTHNGQGTVDSRSSFHSEWTASQTQIAQEKLDMVGALPTLHSEGSVGSHNSGRDSGTGDSMPSDAYHTVIPHLGDMGHPVVAYSPQGPYFQQQPDQHKNMLGYPTHVNMMESSDRSHQPHKGMMTAKCTEECLIYGHSDACWMPDSLLRPPSRLASFRQQESDDMKSPAQNLNHMANDLRYHNGDPNTPFYYDPGRKFVHMGNNAGEYPQYQVGTGGRKFKTFRDENGGEFDSADHNNHSGYPMQYPGSHPGSQAGSQAPSNLSASGITYQHPNVYPSQMYQGRNNPSVRGKPYVNLQGYDSNSGSAMKVPTEEAHSNLSSASSNTSPYNAGFAPQPYYHDPNHPHMHYHDAVPTNRYYDPEANEPEYQQNGMEMHAPYEEDYSASNLLLSPIDNDPDYRQPWKRRIPAQQPGYFSPTKQFNQNGANHPSNQSYNDNKEDEERENLLENRHTVTSTNQTTPEQAQTNEQMEKPDEKLSTIEEIDAEAVVAEIDGLFL